MTLARRTSTRSPEETKARILDAAQIAFADKGYARAVVRDIAEIADVAPSLIIHYFGTKEALFEAEDTLRGSLAAVAAVVRGLEIRTEISGRAAAGLLLATDVADYLVAKGVPFRDAHEIVGSLVRKLVSESRSFEGLTAGEWRAHSPLFEPDVVDWVTPASSVARKRTPQSTHPDMVASAIQEARRWVSSLQISSSEF